METFGLIGYPLGHSFSISFFNEKFANEGIDAQYCNFQIENIASLPEVLAQNPTLKGLNVTLPYKEAVISFLDDITPEARAIGAVNVIRVEHKGGKTLLKGFNSDVIGFTKSIEPMLERFHKKALILGPSGSAKADAITYDEVTPELIRDYHVVVNCTPCGMYPKADACPPLPYDAMDSHHLLYDLIYNPDETRFMQKGIERGALVKNGLEMLLLQAFESWNFWHQQ